MTAYNPRLIKRLCAEAREDDARMADPPWQTEMPGGAFGGRLMTFGGDRGVVALQNGIIQEAIARTRNNLSALVDQLEASGARIAKLESDIADGIRYADTRDREIVALIAERDALRTQLDSPRVKAPQRNALNKTGRLMPGAYRMPSTPDPRETHEDE